MASAPTQHPSNLATGPRPGHLAKVRRLTRNAIRKNSYCTLASSSPEGRPHVAGVLYVEIDRKLYLTVSDDSRKAINIRHNPRVAVCVPVRRIPFAPPYSIQFQGTAEVLDRTHHEIEPLIAAGRLKKILAHGVLEDPKSCFLRITPGRRANVYGFGYSIREIIREPTKAITTIDL